MYLFLLFTLCSYAWSDVHTLNVKITELNSRNGHILYLLFKSEKGFPDDESKSVRQGKIPASEIENGINFEDLSAGEYALSVIHDENDNDKLDTNFMGIPKEGFGFSKNPRIMFGPPSFEKCSFKVPESSTLTIELKHF